MNLYEKLKNENQERYNRFADTDNNVVSFFSKEQFQRVLAKIGLKDENEFAEHYYHLTSGAYVRKDKSEELDKIWEENEKAIEKAIENDPDGKHFVKDMFSYEMANHEYSYTRDISSTLDALGYSLEDINNNPKLLAGLNAALDDVKLFDEFEDLCNCDIALHLYDQVESMSAADRKVFTRDLANFLDINLPERELQEGILYSTFAEYRKDLLKKFIDEPQADFITKYGFEKGLEKNFKYLNEIIGKLELKDYVLNDYLGELNPDINKVKELLSGKVGFKREYLEYSETDDLCEFIEKNFDQVKPVIMQNLLNMNDEALSDLLNEILDLTSNDRVRTARDFFRGSYYDQPYNSAVEFVHDRKDAAYICGDDGHELHGGALYNHADDLRFFYCEADNEPGERDHCTYACIKPENIIQRVGITKDNINMLADDNEELVKKLISNPVSKKQSKSLGR